MYRIHLKTRDWETMLSYTQKEKYKNAIRQEIIINCQGLKLFVVYDENQD